MSKTRYLTVVILLLSVSVALAQPTRNWVARYNNGPDDSTDVAADLVVDASGNVYVTGRSWDDSTKFDYLTVKYNSLGTQLWVARYNDTTNGDDQACAIALDLDGNVYVTGYSTSLNHDYATIKYDPSGTEVWVKRYNGSDNRIRHDEARDLAVDERGNVYVTGYSWVSYPNLEDFLTIKYDTNGSQVWTAFYDGIGNDWDVANDLAVDAQGNVYVTGHSRNPGTGVDYATVRYDSLGTQLWVATYNGSANGGDYGLALTVDGSSNVYVTGESWGTNYDYLTVKYNRSGTQLWTARYNGPGNGQDWPHDLAVDDDGNVYVTGQSPGAGTDLDYCTIKYDPLGAQSWVARYNGPADSIDGARALAVDVCGNVYVTGLSTGSVSDYDYATIKYDFLGTQLWVDRYNGPGNYRDGGTALFADDSGYVHVTGYSHGVGTNADYATIKYSQPLVMICDLPDRPVCIGRYLYFSVTYINSGAPINTRVTFSAYAGLNCDPNSVLMAKPRTRTIPTGTTTTYYYLKVPGAVAAGQYSISMDFAFAGNSYSCCRNADIIQCPLWREGANDEWDLVEVAHPETGVSLPTATALAQNYPNPFNAGTGIGYTLAEPGEVKLSIYNIGGQLVETLVDGYQEADEYQTIWNASGQASGIYFYRLTTGGFTESRRMTLLR